MNKLQFLFLVICKYLVNSAPKKPWEEYTYMSQKLEPRCGIRNLQCNVEGKNCATSNLYDPPDAGRFGNRNVVHGNDSRIGEFPWMVSFRDPSTKENFCGGSLLDRQHILTAAHCFFDKRGGEIKQFKVALGWQQTRGGTGAIKQSLSSMKKFGTWIYPIDNRATNKFGKKPTQKGKIIIHPDYHIGMNNDKVNYANDIAIVKLEEPIQFNKRSDSNFPAHDKGFTKKYFPKGSKQVNYKDRYVTGTFVRPICLPNRRVGRRAKPRELRGWTRRYKEKPTKMFIAGYGNEETGEYQGNPSEHADGIDVQQADILQYSDRMFTMSNGKCKNLMKKKHRKYNHVVWNGNIGAGQVCSKVDPKSLSFTDTCQGDSGGPLAFQVDECWKKSKQYLPKQNLDDIGDCETNRALLKNGDPKPNKQFQLHGIVSWGRECGTDYPAIYTRVSHYLTWIFDNTKHNNGKSYLQFSDNI